MDTAFDDRQEADAICDAGRETVQTWVGKRIDLLLKIKTVQRFEGAFVDAVIEAEFAIGGFGLGPAATVELTLGGCPSLILSGGRRIVGMLGILII